MELTKALAKAEKIVRENGADADCVQLVNWLKELITLRQDMTDLIALVRAQDQVNAARCILERCVHDANTQQDAVQAHLDKEKVELARSDLAVRQAQLSMHRSHAQRILNEAVQTGQRTSENAPTMNLIQQLIDPYITHMCDAELDDLVDSMKHLPPHKTAQDEAHLMSVWDKEDVSEKRAKVTFRIWRVFPELVRALRQMRMRNNALRNDVHDGQHTIRKLTGELAFMEFENGLNKAHFDARTWLQEVEMFNLGQHLEHMRIAGIPEHICNNAAESLYAVRKNARFEHKMAATRWACLTLCR